MQTYSVCADQLVFLCCKKVHDNAKKVNVFLLFKAA